MEINPSAHNFSAWHFGYPRANEHDAEQAVRAALAMVETVPKLATAAGAPLQVRVGRNEWLVRLVLDGFGRAPKCDV